MATYDVKLCMCYGSMALFNAVLHNVFLLYHVETFVSIYKIDKMSFWIGEVVFLIWNSCNDPLFGWVSDKKYLIQRQAADIVLTRLKALSWAGPLFGLSFLGFWVSWTYPSVQFIVCLCVYDGFLTMVDLHHNSLLADLAVSGKTRMKLNTYCALFGVFGSVSVFLSYYVWDRDHFHSFQLFCGILALLSISGFFVSSRYMIKLYKPCPLKDETLEVSATTPSSCSSYKSDLEEEKTAVKMFIRDLMGHKNFVFFGIMNLVQVFHCHFNSNFFPLFLESLLGDSISQTLCSVILGISFIAPHINNLYFLSLCQRYGVYKVIRGLFYLKLILSIVMFLLGPNHIWLLCIFIASNRVFTEGTCKLLNLVISDLVDEDCVLHNRNQAVSALMFGTAAFVSKPGQTLAPLIGTWLLSVQTGHDVFASGGEIGGSIKLDMSGLDSETQNMYRMGVFHLLVYIPIICALVQLLAWSRFSLHGDRLSWIKSLRNDIHCALI